jgi:ribose 5-phosphate isomerase B
VASISRDQVRRLVEQILDDFAPPSAGALTSPVTPGRATDPQPLAGTPCALKPGAAKRVAIGSDHGGFALKRRLKEILAELGYEAVDVGTHSEQSCDYPDFAIKVGQQIQAGACRFGVMIDGAGIGSAMALNKMRGVRAATVHNEATASNSREHNDANVLVLGSAQIHPGHASRILRIWLRTDHSGGRHARRVAKIDALDGLPPRA